MKFWIIYWTILFTIFVSPALLAGDIFVDYNKGNSKNPGTKNAPLPTFRHALSQIHPGDTVYILPSEKPIADNIPLVNIIGTPEKPVIIDGMNNVFLGVKPLDPQEWLQIKPGLFRKKIITGQNWSRRFFLVMNGKINRMGRFNKAPGQKPYKKVEELAPGEWTIIIGKKVSQTGPHPQYEMEYFVRLPEYATSLADSGICEPMMQKTDGVYLRGKSKNIIIRNFIVKHFYNDGYNIHGQCKNIHFENIAAIYCGDDGISAHGDCAISQKNGVFIGCTTAFSHTNNATCKHENFYAEKNIAVETHCHAKTSVDVNNAFLIADSVRGSIWRAEKSDFTIKGTISNIYAVSNNPEASFQKFGPGKVNVKFSNINLAGFGDVMTDKNVIKVPASQLRKKIDSAKKELFSLFNGKLEKII